jgi:hypothetical protein
MKAESAHNLLPDWQLHENAITPTQDALPSVTVAGMAHWRQCLQHAPGGNIWDYARYS